MLNFLNSFQLKFIQLNLFRQTTNVLLRVASEQAFPVVCLCFPVRVP